MSSHTKLVSECLVRPHIEVSKSKRVHHLNPFDLSYLSMDYAQLGYLYAKPSNFSPFSYLESIRLSLSQALVYFYPLAGQLVTDRDEAEHSCYIYVDCSKGPGARLIHASAPGLTIVDVLNPNSHVSNVVLSLFDLGEIGVNYDGHTRPLLSVQVTELRDGVFVGICYNHCVVDGVSVFNFQRVWSHIFMGTLSPSIPLPLVKQPVLLDRRIIKLPYLNPTELIIRSTRPQLAKRVIQFSPQSLKKLKSIANSDPSNSTISTFQALTAFVWKCITRARNLPNDELTFCALPINLRPRFKPLLTNDYFGNYAIKSRVRVKVGDLLGNSIGWAANLLHQSLADVNDMTANAMVLRALLEGPEIIPPTHTLGSNNVIVAGAPRFDLNELSIGLGRLVAFQGGFANKADGKVNTYSGVQGDGSVDLEISLAPDTMTALLSDQEFTNFASQHDGRLNLMSRL